MFGLYKGQINSDQKFVLATWIRPAKLLNRKKYWFLEIFFIFFWPFGLYKDKDNIIRPCHPCYNGWFSNFSWNWRILKSIFIDLFLLSQVASSDVKNDSVDWVTSLFIEGSGTPLLVSILLLLWGFIVQKSIAVLVQ